jgi:CopG family nickel-responsive transcriptional regulator
MWYLTQNWIGDWKMSELVRFGVSLEKRLLERFDALIREGQYTNRSEALRDLIRGEFVKKAWRQGAGKVAGAITLIYDHHTPDLMAKVTDIQHDFQKLIISTQHIHLDHHNCLEIIAVRGKARDVQRLADGLTSIKGVRHGTLSMTGTGLDSE